VIGTSKAIETTCYFANTLCKLVMCNGPQKLSN